MGRRGIENLKSAFCRGDLGEHDGILGFVIDYVLGSEIGESSVVLVRWAVEKV